MKNPWIQPIINAVIISLLGAGGLWFMRHQQPPSRVVVAPPVVPQEQETAVEAPSPPEPAASVASPPSPSPAPSRDVAVAPAPSAPEAVADAEPQPTSQPKPAEPPAEAPVAPPTPPPATPPPTVTAAATPAPEPGATTATLRGVVRFKAPPPRRALIRMDADPKCAAMHADEPPLSEEVLVNDNGTLRNVFVYLKQAPPGQTYNPPRTPVVLDQVGCSYTPRVLGVQVRQPLVIRNSDDTLHNVHALARVNREFNIGQPNRGMESTRVFTQPEVMIRFKCDVHPWMSAYVGVLDHPFFAVTGEDGGFAIAGVPPGSHTVVAWHEKLGTREQTVTVTAGQTAELTFEFGE